MSDLRMMGLFPALCMEFVGDDTRNDCRVLAEVTEVTDCGETEIAFSVGKRRMYLKFKQKDMSRAIKEME